MSRHDANRLTYDEVTIFDVPALFTDLRVDRSTVPDGVYRYEVRYSDEYGGEPVELARGIMVDFFGTVLTREPIQLPISGGMELNLIKQATFGDTVSDEIVAKLGEVREQLINKEIAVFEGPIYAQDGSVMFEDGYRPTIEEINVIDQLVQGVKGSMN